MNISIMKKSCFLFLLCILSSPVYCSDKPDNCPDLSGTYKVHKNNHTYTITQRHGEYFVSYFDGSNTNNVGVRFIPPESKKDVPPCSIVFDDGEYFIHVSDKDKKDIVKNDPRAEPGYTISSDYMIMALIGFEVNYIELDKVR